jgi:hypothetical protein
MRGLSNKEIEAVAGGSTTISVASQQNSVNGSTIASQLALWGSAFVPSATTFVQIAQQINGVSQVTQNAS